MLYVSIELFHQIPIDFNGFCDRFCDFYKSITNRPMDRPTDRPTDQPTDRPTDQWTDIPSYRDAIAASKNKYAVLPMQLECAMTKKLPYVHAYIGYIIGVFLPRMGSLVTAVDFGGENSSQTLSPELG